MKSFLAMSSNLLKEAAFGQANYIFKDFFIDKTLHLFSSKQLRSKIPNTKNNSSCSVSASFESIIRITLKV